MTTYGDICFKDGFYGAPPSEMEGLDLVQVMWRSGSSLVNEGTTSALHCWLVLIR